MPIRPIINDCRWACTRDDLYSLYAGWDDDNKEIFEKKHEEGCCNVGPAVHKIGQRCLISCFRPDCAQRDQQSTDPVSCPQLLIVPDD